MTLPRRPFACIVVCLAAAAVVELFAAPLAWAQDYPTRAVTIVVPFTPAGSTDIIARMLAQKLEQRLGKSFVVENRPGAGTIAEAGLPEFGALPGWHMMVAPGKTPRDVIDKLHAELTAILALPEVDGEIARLGMLPFDNPPVEGLQSFVKSEIVRWGEVVQRAGIAGSE